jgi:hypothetical protein
MAVPTAFDRVAPVLRARVVQVFMFLRRIGLRLRERAHGVTMTQR